MAHFRAVALFLFVSAVALSAAHVTQRHWLEVAHGGMHGPMNDSLSATAGKFWGV